MATTISTGISIFKVSDDSEVYTTIPLVNTNRDFDITVSTDQLIVSTDYYWTASVTDTVTGATTISDKSYFKIAPIPGIVHLTNFIGTQESPVVSTTLTPTLTWSCNYSPIDLEVQIRFIDGADTFVVFYNSLDKDLRSLSIDTAIPTNITNETSGTHTIPTGPLVLKNGLDYRWMVWGHFDPSVASVETGYIHITLPNLNPNVSLLTFNGTQGTPNECKYIRPVLSWHYTDPENNPQSSYIVNVYDSDGVNVFQTNWINSSATSVTLPATTLNADSLYYWNVQVMDSYNNTSDISSDGYFMTGLPPTLTSCNGLTSDDPNIVNTIHPVWSWSYDEVCSVFDVVFNDPTGATGKIEQPNIDNTYTCNEDGIVFGTVYYWWVYLTNDSGMTSFPSVRGYWKAV